MLALSALRNAAVIGCAMALAACARAPAKPDTTMVASASEPAAPAAPYWTETHYKVGARLYPRCVTLTSTGSRVNKVRYCMTDAEIASLEDRTQSIRQDLQQRATIHLGPDSF